MFPESGENAIIGRLGRCFEIKRPVDPVSREDGDDLHLQFFRSMTNQFGGSLRDVELRRARPQDLQIAGLGFADDAVHHLDRFQRVLPGSGFGGKHQRIAAVENGVGDVGGLGARGARVLRHGFEHLGCGDHRQARLARPSR